jgi:predicted deacetylase
MTAPVSRTGLRALVSIHDVMPETRTRVTELLRRMPEAVPPESIVLLVVPGRDWSGADREWLHALQRQGYELAGHGWFHQCDPPRTLYHRLHSLLLSRDAAEHLSLDADAIAGLIRANRRWFDDQGLESPQLYVPPAWALGAIPRADLQALPFRYYETLSGIHDVATGRFRRLPVIGFEADTPGRARVLRLINAIQLQLARWWRRPVRLAIHPQDAELYLARDLRACLDAVTWSLNPASLPD